MNPPRIIPAARILRTDHAPASRRFVTGLTVAAAVVSLVLAAALPARALHGNADLAMASEGIPAARAR